jgi:hypothetical protein
MAENDAGEQPEQSFEELIKLFGALQEKAKMQDLLVRKFQKLIQDDGLFSTVAIRFPYPMAAFRQDGALVFVNDALSEETGLTIADLPTGKHNIINRITDPNYKILDAVDNVFMGETTFLYGLSDPLDMFISERSGKKTLSSDYQDALLFPLIEETGEITHGAAIFLKIQP